MSDSLESVQQTKTNLRWTFIDLYDTHLVDSGRDSWVSVSERGTER